MRVNKLKIGDKIRIIRVPGEGIPNYYIHRDTVRVYKKIIARRQPVRINRIDEYGSRWFSCRFKMQNGTWEWNYLAVYEDDNNWVIVKRKSK
jgi:hypothetical protein